MGFAEATNHFGNLPRPGARSEAQLAIDVDTKTYRDNVRIQISDCADNDRVEMTLPSET